MNYISAPTPDQSDLIPSSSVPVATETVDISDETQYCPVCHKVWDRSEVHSHSLEEGAEYDCDHYDDLDDNQQHRTRWKGEYFKF